MSELFDLAEVAKKLAETSKDAMKNGPESEPDDVSWGLALQVVEGAKRLLPTDQIVQRINLETKLWVSIRSAMEAVAVKLSSKGTADVVAASDRANPGRMRRGY